MRISDWSSDVCSSDLRVAVAIEADEACAGDGMLALMEAVERCQDRLQGRSLHIQRLGDGNIPAFGMGMMLGPASALGLQPPVELGQAGEPEPRLEEAASAIGRAHV